MHYTLQFRLTRITKKVLATKNVPIVDAVNARDSRDNTPLTIAAKNDQYDMARMLLDKGADVNAQGGAYGNALQAASQGGHEQVVKRAT